MTNTDLLGPGSGDEVTAPDDREALAEAALRYPLPDGRSIGDGTPEGVAQVAFLAGAAWSARRQPEPVKPTEDEPVLPAGYTPSDGDVEVAYVERAESVCGTGHFAAGLEFDRWVAKVKAEAWDEGEEAGRHNERCIVDLDETTNPYRIERGES